MVLYLNIFQVAIYGFLGVASVAVGAYHLKSGMKTPDPPRTSHVIWSIVLLVVVSAMGIATVWYNSPNGPPNLPRSDDQVLESGRAMKPQTVERQSDRVFDNLAEYRAAESEHVGPSPNPKPALVARLL